MGFGKQQLASCRGRRPKQGLSGGSVSHPWLTRRARPSMAAADNPRSVRCPSSACVPASAVAATAEAWNFMTRRPPDCRGYAPSAPSTGNRRRGSGRALWRLQNERMRAPACGSGADVQAAGHTPGGPVAPAWGDAFLLLGNQTATAKSLDPCFRRDDGKSNSNVHGSPRSDDDRSMAAAIVAPHCAKTHCLHPQ
jgi:hypothetical protein